MLKIGLNFADSPEQLCTLHLCFWRVNRDVGFVRAIQKSEQAIILFLQERVVFVVVALSTLDRDTQDALADGVHAIEHGFHAELLRVHAAFLIDHGIAQKTRGHPLVLRRVREQVPGQLVDDELVVRQIAIEGLDHPIAIKPDLT